MCIQLPIVTSAAVGVVCFLQHRPWIAVPIACALIVLRMSGASTFTRSVPTFLTCGAFSLAIALEGLIEAKQIHHLWLAVVFGFPFLCGDLFSRIADRTLRISARGLLAAELLGLASGIALVWGVWLMVMQISG